MTIDGATIGPSEVPQSYSRRDAGASRSNRHANRCRVVRNLWRRHAVTLNPDLVKRDEVRDAKREETPAGHWMAVSRWRPFEGLSIY